MTPDSIKCRKIALQGHPILSKAMPLIHPGQWVSLHAVIQMIDRMGLLKSLYELPKKAGPAAVARRVVADLGLATALDIAFPVPPGWRRIVQLDELWTIAKRSKLCLRLGDFMAGGYAISFLMGRSVFLFHAESGQLAQFRASPGDTWSLAQCKGPANAEPPKELEAKLIEMVGAAGIWLLPCEADHALQSVLNSLGGLSGEDGEEEKHDDAEAA